jgi:vitamin B12 transporter
MFMKKGLVLSLFLAAGLIGPNLATGAEENEKVMEKVVVTAGRVEEKAKNVTQAVTVISREEIEKYQYTDLGLMLRNYGVQVNSYSGSDSLSQFSLRGLRTPLFGQDVNSPILVMIDGRRAGTTNISMIPVVGVERVEIIRGPASVQYGASAIGGVVNIITKRGKDLQIAAEAGMGSWNSGKTMAGASGSFGPWDFSGGFSWQTTADDYTTGNNRRYRNTRLDNRYAYIVNTGLTFFDEHRIGASFTGVTSDRMGQPNDLAHNTLTPFTERDNNAVDFVYDGGYKEYGLSWKLRYFNAIDNYLSDGDPANPQFRSNANTKGSQAQINFSKGFLSLTAGLDWLSSDYRPDNDSRSEYDNLAGFILAKAMFFEERLILSAGLRYDDYTLRYEDKERKLDNVAPSFGLAVRPLDWLTLRGNYGEGFRIPAAQEVTGYSSTYMGWTTVYQGNPDLKPEKGSGWDAGFEVDYKALNLSGTYFQIDYDNKIATRPFGAGFQYYNIGGQTRYRGLEGQASVDVAQFFDWPFTLRLYGNITHLLTYDDDSGKQLRNVSDTSIGYGLNLLHPAAGLSADLRFTYFGYQNDLEYDPVTWASRPVRHGGQTTADFFISKTLWNWENAGTLSIKGEIRNIFNTDYSTIWGYPMPGRSFYIGLRYDY